MIRTILLAALLGGCTLRVELVAKEDPPSVIEWREKVTGRVNEHDKRIEALEVRDGRANSGTAEQ